MTIQIDNSKDANLTDFSKAVLQDRYLLKEIKDEEGNISQKNENFQELFKRVAEAYKDDDAHGQRIYDYMSKCWFMPASPVLTNGGTTRGLPISCFLNETLDTIDSIAQTYNENIYLAVSGGGIGTHWGNVRSINETITNRGTSSGIVPFLKVQDSFTLAISQGALRRGSSAAYLPISHPEIEEFIDIRRPTGGDPNRRCLNLHHGVVLTDDFMKAVEKGGTYWFRSPKDNNVIKEVLARDLWIKILSARIETGEPYILYEGNMQKNKSPVYQAMEEKYGMKPKTSNLCVAPETLILTDNGWVDIKGCANQKTTIWNGFEWSDVVPRKTGENQKLITVVTSDGQKLECTEYHKWYIQTQDAYGKATKIIEKRTHELCVNDKIIKNTFPVINGTLELSFAYANGFYSGDGCQLKNGKSRVYLYGAKSECESRLDVENMSKVNCYYQEEQNRLYFDIAEGVLKYKFYVPTADYTIKARLDWFAGLCDSDGTIARNESNQSLQIASVNKEFLLNVQKMLQELGCTPKITFTRKAGKYMLPKNDGSGDLKEYNCKEVNRLIISSNDLHSLVCMGLKFERLQYNKHLPQRQASAFTYIKEIKDDGRISDTYCFTEPKRNMAVFNGILTGNCSEITLFTGLDQLQKERTAVCCLSSLNLEYFEEWRNNELFIEDIMRFLDNVLTDFIDRAPDTMEKAKYSAMRERSVGLGVMGFHSFLQSKNTPFEGVAAKSWNKTIFKHIKEKCDLANEKLANDWEKQRGACPDAKDLGLNLRFSNCTAIAPTASISIICGNSSPGIEPFIANCYTHKTLSGTFIVRNKHLVKLLESKGKNTSEVWSSISMNEGSIMHLDFLEPEEKDVFKTAMEINQMWLIDHAADRQPFIDQAQSLNIFVPSNVAKAELHKIHIQAWKKGIKSLYYCRSASIQRAEKTNQPKAEELHSTQKEVGIGGLSTNDECLACQ